MTQRMALCALPMLLAAQAAGQTVLYGVRGNGDVVRINPATGAAVLVGSSGVGCGAGAADNFGYGHRESIVIGGGAGTQADHLSFLNRWTGAVWQTGQTTVAPPGYGVRAILGADRALYVILGAGNGTTIDLLATVSSYGGAYTVIGPTGRTDAAALARSPWGELYALGTDGGGSLYRLSASTGAATLVGAGGFGDDDRALEFLPDGTLLACGANLLSVNPSTGATTLIGPTGFTDIRGLAAVTRESCYANCSDCPLGGCSPPVLNVLDFNCFLNRFAAGDPYSNCDQSTSPPVLSVLDFMCFLNCFAASCSGC